MKIAILSDLHENFNNLKKVLKELKERDVKEAIFLGDFINPGVANELFTSGLKIKAIFGNNDGDRAEIMRLAIENNVEMATFEFAEYMIDGKKVFAVHYPIIGKSVAKSGDYDAVFYGHNHEIKIDKLPNGCLLANPGEISSHKTGKATFLIWDTKENDVESVEIANPTNVKSE